MSLSCLKPFNGFPFANIPQSPSYYLPTSLVSYSPFSLMKHQPYWFFPISEPLYYMFFLLGRLSPTSSLGAFWLVLLSTKNITASGNLSLTMSPTTTQLSFTYPTLYYSEKLLLLKILYSCVYCLHSPHQNINNSRAET